MTRPYNLEDAKLTRPLTDSNMKWGVLSRIIAVEYTIDIASPPVVMLDPTAGAVDVLLPPEAANLVYWIVNLHASNILTLKNDADGAFSGNVLAGTASVMVVCDGTVWRGYKMALATS